MYDLFEIRKKFGYKTGKEFFFPVFKYLSVVHSTTVKTSVSAFSYALQCIFSVEPFSCLSISGCCLILASVFLKSYASFTLKDFTKIFSKGNQNLV